MNGWPTQDAQRPLPGVPGYRVARVIGEGGMSTVYLGTQLSLGREVAIKVMRPEALADEVSRRRFENEARTIARLEHPHIVGIHEVGRTDDGLPWYAMPHLARGHVGQRDLTADPQRVREILRALLSALAFAHARGVIHRDVKAENVLFDEADRPLLADFGIALRRGHGTRVTMTGLAVGSTAYMAPEQARGQQVDHRADLYSVGVLAWEMLTGELPYKADDALSMAIQHAQNPIPKLPPALRHWQKFFDRAMAKSPRKRFADAAQMLEALDRVPVHQRSRGPDPRELLARMRARLRRVTRPAWVAVALVLAAAIGLGMHGRSPSEAGPAAAGRTAGPASAADGSESDASAGAPAGTHTPGDAPGDMLAAAPLSTADRLLEQARAQVEAGRLAAPAGDNAGETLLEAARADPTHPQLAGTATRVSDALRDATVRAIARDRASDLDLLLRTAARVQATGVVPDAARASWRTRVGEAIESRAEAALTRVDRAAALRMADAAGAAGLPDATVRQLRARAERLPDLQGRDPGNLDGMKVLEGTARPLAAYLRPVTRSEYARFAETTGREPSLCRERASLLRMVSPRDWTRPGFDQGDGDPVVCVSVADVEAYAQWFGRRDGHRYRLPTAAEAAGLPATGGRALSEWRADCAADCAKRRAAGASFRSGEASRTLDADRGYDDVGFRLVREL
ncbi:protein kinase domain-containing protein [Luteimonas kalidii]|uniref:Protein kinase n=1 Tax=Luteimonas kalidii TaxID=3042025 RepID=A0ABT6JYB1_9GAMM|nr:bifunctional serine/threonine-protein kinase/formylglycine-generating enzyme family protein [Luteimonas kalidii]MDH5835676.1 protein kinase [Luteimonas kalidii]